MNELFEAAEEAFEEAFPPKPGGLVDKYRQRKADEEAKQEDRENAEERIEEQSFRAVKVAVIPPSIFSPAEFTIAAGGYAMVLPLSLYRYQATLRVVTAASSVILAKDSGAAISGNGFPLLTADPPLRVNARAQLWAFNPGGAPVTIAVLSEIYAPEQ